MTFINQLMDFTKWILKYYPSGIAMTSTAQFHNLFAFDYKYCHQDCDGG